MADTVKTGLLKAIATRLDAIDELAVVKRWEDIPADLSGLDLPVLFYWEEEEIEPYNRLTKGTLDFWMQAFFALDPADPTSFTEFTDSAETVAGAVRNMFAYPDELRTAGLIMAMPKAVYKTRFNSDYGVLFMLYQLIYGHAAGNAFSLDT